MFIFLLLFLFPVESIRGIDEFLKNPKAKEFVDKYLNFDASIRTLDILLDNVHTIEKYRTLSMRTLKRYIKEIKVYYFRVLFFKNHKSINLSAC